MALALELSPDPFKGSVNENPLPWGFAPAKRMVELMVGKWSDSNQIMLQKNCVAACLVHEMFPNKFQVLDMNRRKIVL